MRVCFEPGFDHKETIVKFLRFTLFSTILALGLSSQANAGPMENGIIRMGGSTTLLPIISKVASDFMEQYDTWDKVDPSLPKKDIVIFVSGGGSGFGVKSAINGTVHIGMASRNLKAKEVKALGEHKLYLIGKDAVVFAANKNNVLAVKSPNFEFADVKKLFSGKAKTYKNMDASLSPKEIVLFVRDAGAGSAEMLQKLIMGKSQISPSALQLPSQGALLKKLETNTSGIGYISSGLVFGSDKVHAFSLKGVEPSNENVINGKYAFVRPLNLVVKGLPDPMTAAFINHLLTDGQKVVVANNYVPANIKMAAR
jgi:phosphate transport system substrate-binding protein